MRESKSDRFREVVVIVRNRDSHFSLAALLITAKRFGDEQ